MVVATETGSCDEKGNIASDPNRPDDPQYIVRLIGQVITVSLETLKLVQSLAAVQSQAKAEKPIEAS
jgi:predicted helicase